MSNRSGFQISAEHFVAKSGFDVSAGHIVAKTGFEVSPGYFVVKKSLHYLINLRVTRCNERLTKRTQLIRRAV